MGPPPLRSQEDRPAGRRARTARTDPPAHRRYIPFDPEAASLFFSLVSSRYEQSSLIVSPNKSISAWAEIFGDAVAVAAMVDRLIHDAQVIVLKGDSYRLRGKHKVTAAKQT